MKRLYLALDLETTGLHPNEDKILEVGWTTLDSDFTFIRYPVRRTVQLDDEVWDMIKEDPFIEDMHSTSGLLDDLTSDDNTSLYDIEGEVLDSLDSAQQVVGSKTSETVWHLLGSSVHFDRSFLDVHMPFLSAELNHRILDVSSLLLAAEGSGMKITTNNATHRADEDVSRSIRLLKSVVEGWTE